MKLIDTKNGTGKGIICKHDLMKDDFIISYLGELYHKNESNWKPTYYTMNLRGGFRVDASRVGNYASLINHSCVPNCIVKNWNHKGYDRRFIFALYKISANTELTYQYEMTYANILSYKKCLCGNLY